jgi:hypothetical protein
MRRIKNYPLTRLAQAATDDVSFPPRALWALRLKPLATARLEYVEATARSSAHAWLRLPDGTVVEPDARPRDLPSGFERFADPMEHEAALKALADAEAVRLTLWPTVPHLWAQMIAAFRVGNVAGMLSCVDPARLGATVYANWDTLARQKLVERACLYAYQKDRLGARSLLAYSLPRLDRARLRDAGDPIPPGMLTLYRGVSGRAEPQRRTAGLSWTANPDVARWFAGRAAYVSTPRNGANPAVYRLRIHSRSVLAHVSARGEDEFLVAVDALQPKLFEQVTRERFEAACARLRDASVKS